MLTLAIYALRHDANKEGNPNRSGRQFLARIAKTEAVAGEAWLDYRRSFPKGEDDKSPQPSVAQLAHDAILALPSIREMTIIRLASLFEAFLQCWALNYLAGILEAGDVWSKGEADLATALHPIRGGGHLPGWPQIVGAFPKLKEGLSRIPHAFTHPSEGVPITSPISKTLNAFTIIQFWRAYRNLSVHTSRLVTRRFYDRYWPVWSEMMTDLHHVDRLEPGKPMPLHDDLFSQMAAVQYRAAIWMNEQLAEITHLRRGHPEAPGSVTRTRFEPTFRCRPLFVDGDHAPSLQWTNDPSFREALCKKEGWELTNDSMQLEARRGAADAEH